MRLLQLKGHGGFRNGKWRRALFFTGLFSVHNERRGTLLSASGSIRFPANFVAASLHLQVTNWIAPILIETR